jgi:hypothetical protein
VNFQPLYDSQVSHFMGKVTYFHMEMDWGLDETNVLRNVRKIENILIKSGMFSVGGKKAKIAQRAKNV